MFPHVISPGFARSHLRRAFSRLAFDHLVFTGSAAVGRQIMRAAAENLVPVTLELGGKSPVIIGRSANLRQAAERIAIGKLTNVGQLCLSPHYLLVPREHEQELVRHIVNAASAMYPTLLANADFSSVTNRQNRERVQGYLADARKQGAELIEVNPSHEDFVGAARECNSNKMPLTLVRGVIDRMALMQHEIFGPILPVLSYETVDDAIAYVNARDRPLALYYFGTDRAEERHILSHPISGGVTVNDVLFHHAMEELPFGCVGASGMGSYHGIDGFKAFSHARAVYRQPRMDVAALTGCKPPCGKVTQRSLQRELRK